jgi:hypothetical protein
MKKFYDEFFSLTRLRDKSDEKKSAYMRQVLDFIASADFTINNPRYYNNDGKRYQMRWYGRFVNYIPLMARAFDILQTMILVNIDSMGIQPGTLKSYERDGYLVNFDSTQGLTSFIVPYPGPALTGARGGRRNKMNKFKKVRSKRHNHKKNKNTRKNR